MIKVPRYMLLSNGHGDKDDFVGFYDNIKDADSKGIELITKSDAWYRVIDLENEYLAFELKEYDHDSHPSNKDSIEEQE